MIDQNMKDAIEIGGRLLPSLVETVAEIIAAGASAAEAEAVVRKDIQSRVERYERERDEDEAALDAKHGGDVSVVLNGRPTRLPARAAYEQLVAAAGMSGQPTVVVRGAGAGRTVTPGQVVDLAAGATVNVAHTSHA
ncbi:MAG: hypothetical protein RLP09_09540 [Sandaracinaceae bacterium]